jgi:hypothetical protein
VNKNVGGLVDEIIGEKLSREGRLVDEIIGGELSREDAKARREETRR